tara:strand:- start:89 stop:454 length:366 start_codon:yes stop_codon:yes gene_type:complete
MKLDDAMLVVKDRALLQEILLDHTFAAIPGAQLPALLREIERVFKFPDDTMRNSHSAYTLLQFYSQITLNSFIQSQQSGMAQEIGTEQQVNFHESLIHGVICVESMMLTMKKQKPSSNVDE